jgi:hypothetical protein
VEGLTQTIAINRALGSWILNAKEIKRMATGLNAWDQLVPQYHGTRSLP